MPLRIVADDSIPFLRGVVEPEAEITYINVKDFCHEAIKDADALIVRSIDKCTRAVLENTRIKMIATATIGFDHIDTAYCATAGISWQNAPGCNAESVAEYLLCAIAALSVRSGYTMRGKTIGIVGAGHVGMKVKRLSESMGMTVLLNDPPRAEAEGQEAFVSLETIAEQSDIITFHVPLTRDGQHATFHLANEYFFNNCCRKPLFINSCRGAVMDTSALLKARHSGLLGDMIIDCWENEPTISRPLLKECAIATPHIAGFSADGKANATRMSLENIEAFFDVHFSGIKTVVPPAPTHPVIDLELYQDHRIERAICSAFNPEVPDRLLRKSPDQFEYFRAHYPYPREFAAYQIKGGTIEERVFLSKLGFNML